MPSQTALGHPVQVMRDRARRLRWASELTLDSFMLGAASAYESAADLLSRDLPGEGPHDE